MLETKNKQGRNKKGRFTPTISKFLAGAKPRNEIECLYVSNSRMKYIAYTLFANFEYIRNNYELDFTTGSSASLERAIKRFIYKQGFKRVKNGEFPTELYHRLILRKW